MILCLVLVIGHSFSGFPSQLKRDDENGGGRVCFYSVINQMSNLTAPFDNSATELNKQTSFVRGRAGGQESGHER